MKIVEVNKEDLIHNINIIKDLNKLENGLKSPKIIGVVKGNAYGLGLVEFSKFLIEQGIDYLAVATTEEALKLRENNINCTILMLSSIGIRKEIENLLDNNIILTIGSYDVAKIVNDVAIERKIKAKVHLKIDTGFGRYGFLYNEPFKIVELLKEFLNIEIIGCFSHFSESYSKDSKWTTLQFNRFLNVIEILKKNNINTRDVTYL